MVRRLVTLVLLSVIASGCFEDGMASGSHDSAAVSIPAHGGIETVLKITYRRRVIRSHRQMTVIDGGKGILLSCDPPGSGRDDTSYSQPGLDDAAVACRELKEHPRLFFG